MPWWCRDLEQKDRDLTTLVVKELCRPSPGQTHQPAHGVVDLNRLYLLVGLMRNGTAFIYISHLLLLQVCWQPKLIPSTTHLQLDVTTISRDCYAHLSSRNAEKSSRTAFHIDLRPLHKNCSVDAVSDFLFKHIRASRAHGVSSHALHCAIPFWQHLSYSEVKLSCGVNAEIFFTVLIYKKSGMSKSKIFFRPIVTASRLQMDHQVQRMPYQHHLAIRAHLPSKFSIAPLHVVSESDCSIT